MNWVTQLTRDELLNDIDAFRDNEEFLRVRDSYMRHAIESLDCELTERLLETGANPMSLELWGDDLLHSLAYEYISARTTKGSDIVRIMEMVLEYGADPNHVGQNNWRAIDICIEHNAHALVDLLVKHGASPRQREFI